MTDNELLLAITNIVQSQTEPLKQNVLDTQLFLENEVLPRLQNIESCYSTTYHRYATGIQHLDSLQNDMNLVKKVVGEHSELLQKIS